MTGQIPVEQYRLFIAFQVPEAIRKKMLCVQRELQTFVPPGAIRWTKPEQFHLTLRFLGNVPSDSLSALQEAVRAVCVTALPLHLYARGLGFFPNARSPRVVWVGINDGENRLTALQSRIESATGPFTSEPAGGYFAGHVTLGRFKQFKNLNVKELRVAADKLKNQLFGGWTADEIEIMRSELLETGPRHAPVASIRLGMEVAH